MTGSGTVAPAPPLITCLGEALIDFLPFEEAGRTVAFRPHPGGSLLNVAVAVARLGGRAALATGIAGDYFGRSLRMHLEREGVDTRWLVPVDALSALAFVAIEAGEPAFAFYGQGTADTAVTTPDLPAGLFRETAVLHVGSISLLRGSTPAAVVAACERLRGSALLSLDPNLRPSLVQDESAYRDRLDHLFGMVDLVKVSAADLTWLAPGRDPEAAALDLLERGPVLVVVTHGGRGAAAMRRVDGRPVRMSLPAFPVHVVDTIGAGDAFDAGLLSQLAERGVTSRAALAVLPDDDLRAALRFAVAAAALNCERHGADAPQRSAVDAFLATNGDPARASGIRA